MRTGGRAGRRAEVGQAFEPDSVRRRYGPSGVRLESLTYFIFVDPLLICNSSAIARSISAALKVVTISSWAAPSGPCRTSQPRAIGSRPRALAAIAASWRRRRWRAGQARASATTIRCQRPSRSRNARSPAPWKTVAGRASDRRPATRVNSRSSRTAASGREAAVRSARKAGRSHRASRRRTASRIRPGFGRRDLPRADAGGERLEPGLAATPAAGRARSSGSGRRAAPRGAPGRRSGRGPGIAAVGDRSRRLVVHRSAPARAIVSSIAVIDSRGDGAAVASAGRSPRGSGGAHQVDPDRRRRAGIVRARRDAADAGAAVEPLVQQPHRDRGRLHRLVGPEARGEDQGVARPRRGHVEEAERLLLVVGPLERQVGPPDGVARPRGRPSRRPGPAPAAAAGRPGRGPDGRRPAGSGRATTAPGRAAPRSGTPAPWPGGSTSAGCWRRPRRSSPPAPRAARSPGRPAAARRSPPA